MPNAGDADEANMCRTIQADCRVDDQSGINLAAELTAQGHPLSHDVVSRRLREAGYNVQSTRKHHEGKQHPDRDARYNYISKTAQAKLDRGLPVISIDTGSKELIGNFKQQGTEWQPKGCPVEVETDDFPSIAQVKVVPYGVYDILNNEGWVSVGISSDTAEVAVETIAKWWEKMGRERFGEVEEIVVTADCGGSNGYRTRLWRQQLQELVNRFNVRFTVLHYQPGTSQWNYTILPS